MDKAVLTRIMVIACGSAISAAGLVAATPFASSATADVAAERIEVAFQSLAAAGIETGAAVRGNSRQDCAAATWPHVDDSCLITPDGSRAEPARFVRIAY
jgi:hypothetical protein